MDFNLNFNFASKGNAATAQCCFGSDKADIGGDPAPQSLSSEPKTDPKTATSQNSEFSRSLSEALGSSNDGLSNAQSVTTGSEPVAKANDAEPKATSDKETIQNEDEDPALQYMTTLVHEQNRLLLTVKDLRISLGLEQGPLSDPDTVWHAVFDTDAASESTAVHPEAFLLKLLNQGLDAGGTGDDLRNSLPDLIGNNQQHDQTAGNAVQADILASLTVQSSGIGALTSQLEMQTEQVQAKVGVALPPELVNAFLKFEASGASKQSQPVAEAKVEQTASDLDLENAPAQPVLEQAGDSIDEDVKIPVNKMNLAEPRQENSFAERNRVQVVRNDIGVDGTRSSFTEKLDTQTAKVSAQVESLRDGANAKVSDFGTQVKVLAADDKAETFNVVTPKLAEAVQAAKVTVNNLPEKTLRSAEMPEMNFEEGPDRVEISANSGGKNVFSTKEAAQSASPSPVRQVSETVESGIPNGKRSMELELKPEGLGSVKIKVIETNLAGAGKQLLLQIRVNTAEAHSLLKAHLGELREALGNYEIQLQPHTQSKVQDSSASAQQQFERQSEEQNKRDESNHGNKSRQSRDEELDEQFLKNLSEAFDE